MGTMKFLLTDAERSVHGPGDAELVNALVPALSDDPETIEELSRAMRRFLPPEEQPVEGADRFAMWSEGLGSEGLGSEGQGSEGIGDEPLEAGLCIIDLTARLIVFSSSSCELLTSGLATFDDESIGEPTRWIPYRIADDWLVVESPDGWRELSSVRRRTRAASAPLDTRAVLYGKVVDFLVDECRSARGGRTTVGGEWKPPRGWRWRELPEREVGAIAARAAMTASDGIAEIHARWLMTPRDDLRGKTPRQILLRDHPHLFTQLRDREAQWSNFGSCPAPLWRESRAYRLGGYATHELRLYYDLVRHLTETCWKAVVEPPSGQQPPATEEIVRRLRAEQQDWLNTPQERELAGKTPAHVIECERLRLPIGVSGEAAMVDCDCPLCQMMADEGPVFLHLDGSHMDDDFPFSVFHPTRRQWEHEQRARAEWEADMERRRQASIAAGGNPSRRPSGKKGARDDGQVTSSVWQRSFTTFDPNESLVTSLFGIGSHLAELILDVRESKHDDSRNWIDTLNRDFGNLREAVADASKSLVDPVVARFQEHLSEVGGSMPTLRAKCGDLEKQLERFAGRYGERATQTDR